MKSSWASCVNRPKRCGEYVKWLSDRLCDTKFCLQHELQGIWGVEMHKKTSPADCGRGFDR
ncbi:hypothetical protein RBSH_04425 [Rhodopirellula baltica SH28]|uniref:Uncharacterized protein n=1 Tax=Rhodopirellula baltica SH28 TaxID=993517 RepID=K5CAJ7_RHOBT|nr:hypothetical protein RBSH_04425 [Rhodopirellula baltica SH28]